MKGKKKRDLRKKTIKSEKKINQKNKNLMIDKILSYNPMILEGIERYKDANRDFKLLIFLGTLLIDFPLISVPCCILSMFFTMKMLQFIRYKSINNIVIELAKDLSFKGIYNKEKVDDMLDNFKFKYGEDIIEYEELVNMLDKYDTLVTKIERVLRGINIKEDRNLNDEDNSLKNGEISFLNKEDNIICEVIKGNQYNGREVVHCYKDINEKLSVLYKRENGNIKRVNKAIEFFDDQSYDSQDAVVIKNTNKDNKKLTIYLYKKASNLQKNAL
ncbi:MAG TPA: hypothetical protein VF839_07055 [Clostridium sp.]